MVLYIIINKYNNIYIFITHLNLVSQKILWVSKLTQLTHNFKMSHESFRTLIYIYIYSVGKSIGSSDISDKKLWVPIFFRNPSEVPIIFL